MNYFSGCFDLLPDAEKCNQQTFLGAPWVGTGLGTSMYFGNGTSSRTPQNTPQSLQKTAGCFCNNWVKNFNNAPAWLPISQCLAIMSLRCHPRSPRRSCFDYSGLLRRFITEIIQSNPTSPHYSPASLASSPTSPHYSRTSPICFLKYKLP